MSSLWRFIWFSLPIIFLLLTAIYIPIKLHDENGFDRVEKLSEQLKSIKIHNQKLQRENQAILKKIKAIYNDPDYIENIARNEMGMIAPNEVIYQF